ncbi:MAG: ISH3 family transposase [Candidatus Hydrothermarchaeales archaeon]
MTQKTKNPNPIRLRSWDILNLALSSLIEHIDIPIADNATYTHKDIFNVILNASCATTSINDITTSSEKTPSEGDMRHHLKKLSLGELQEMINEMLLRSVVRTIPSKPLSFAIDLHLIPYHGEPYSDRKEITRSMARDGTTHFHAYASIYLILKKRRYTLAVKFCKSEESLVGIIEYLLAKVEEAKLRIKSLFLDRCFYSVPVINYLQAKQVSFIIPCITRGRSGGIRRLFKGRKSYATMYTMRSQRYGAATFQVNVDVRYWNGRWKRHGIEYLAFAVYGIDVKPGKTRMVYRKRFGIESSYRLMNRTRARTSSRNPVIRLLFVGVSFLLQNLWIYLKWALSKKFPSLERLCFKTMARQLLRCLEDAMGFVDLIGYSCLGPSIRV